MNDDPPPWQSKPRFSRRFGCLLFGVGLPLLVLLLLVAIYMIWSARSNARARRALAAIRATGEPVDASELNAFYTLPEGADDVTRLWLIPMRAFDGPEYRQACEPLPIVGWSEDEQPIPPPGEPWQDIEAVEAFLAKYADEMAAAHAAAQRGGAARYPADYSQGWEVIVEHIQQARALARMLALEARVRAHRGDWPGAVRSIRDLHKLAGSLEREPLLTCQLVRYAIDGVARGTLQDLMEAEDFPAEQFASLQDLLRSIDYGEGLERALIGERAMGVSTFDDAATLGHDVPAGLVRLVPRGDDLAMFIDSMSRAVAAARLEEPERLREFEALGDDLQDTFGNLGPIDRFRYAFSAMLLPAVSSVATAEARNTAQDRAAAAVIAAERSRRKHGRLPKDLDELVPGFLAEVPVDPFSGEPLKYKAEDGKATVYTVGENRIDEQGQNDLLTGSPGDRDDWPFPERRAPDQEE